MSNARTPPKIHSKQSASKDVDRLDITVEVEGTKPINVTVEINLLLSKQTKGIDAETLVKDATKRTSN